MADGRFLPVSPWGRQQAPPPVFGRLAIVGLGPVGTAVAIAARQACPSALVIGVDRNDRLETCIRIGAIDIGADDPIIVAEAELVVLAVPLAEQESWLSALPDLVPGPALVTSLRGAEGVPVAAGTLPERFRFIAGHLQPAGLADDLRYVSGDAISGSAWAVAGREGDSTADRLAAFVSSLGARPVRVDGIAGLRAFLQPGPDAV